MKLKLIISFNKIINNESLKVPEERRKIRKTWIDDKKKGKNYVS